MAQASLGTTLERWLQRLDLDGFQVGLRERLTIQDFVARLAMRGELPDDDRDLLRLLMPLVCTTPESQRRYQALLNSVPARRPSFFRRHRRGGKAAPLETEAPPRPRLGKALLLVVAVLLALAAAAYFWPGPQPTPAVQPPPDGPNDAPLQTERPAQATFYPPELPATAPTGGAANQIAIGAAWTVAGLCALLLAWAAAARLRRDMVLHGTRTDAAVEERVLYDPEAQGIALPETPLRFASRLLRQRVAGETSELDLEASLAATVRAAGAFTPCWRPLRHTPEYLVLLDRRHPGDHLAAYGDALVRALREHGVTVQSYRFEGTPDTGCWRVRQGAAGEERFDRSGMAELAARYGGQRLLVLADTEALVDPVSGGPRPWARHLGAFPQRAWFTPMPLPSWGAGETVADARDFLVLPLLAEALPTLAAWFSAGDLSLATERDWPLAFPPLLRNEGAAWVARLMPPPADTLGELAYQLRNHLGPERFQWLAACAIFPALSPALTLALGRELGLDARAQALGMATLGALPWFRLGRMPPWLRETLLEYLSPDNKARFQAVIETRLANAVIGTGGAELARVALRRRLRAWLRRGTGPARDVVLVDFLRRGTASRLAQAIPAALRQRLFPDGLIDRGLRPALVAALAALLVASAGLGAFLRIQGAASPPPAQEKIQAMDMISCPGASLDDATLALGKELAAGPGLPMSGATARVSVSVYTPEAWKTRTGKPVPNPGELHVPGQTTDWEGLRAWLAPRAPLSGTSWAIVPDSASELPTANVCNATANAVVEPAPSTGIQVYVHIGSESQRAWANNIARRLNALPGVQAFLQRVDLKRLPNRVEVRAAKGGNPDFIKRLEAELAGNLDTPAVRKAIELLKGAKLADTRYEIWASNSLCVTRVIAACGQGGKQAAPAAVIREFVARPASVAPGAEAQLCFAVENAARITLRPDPGVLKRAGKDCMVVRPTRTTTYTLMVSNAEGASVSRQFTVRVQGAETVPVPKLLGASFDEAQKMLEKTGLKPVRVETTEASRAPLGTVRAQDPEAGAAVAPGSVVTLTVQAVPRAERQGWCCVVADATQRIRGGVFTADEKTCSARAGVFYASEDQALKECAGFAGLTAPAREPAGWKGVDVAEVQGLLAKAGFFKGAGDGVVRDELIKALMQFQEQSGIPPDGIPGPRTLSILRGDSPAPNAPARVQAK